MPRVIHPSPPGFRAIQEIGTIRLSPRFTLRIPDKPDWEEQTMRTVVSSTCLAALALIASVGIAAADEVKLISVGGVKLGLDPIIAEFSKQTGHKVTYTAGSPAMVSQKLAAGEAFDVVVQSVPAMAELAKINGLKAETRQPGVRGG